MTWDDQVRSLDPSEDFRATPIFIQNFNQVSYLRRQLEWLLPRGYRRICIIDNNSTYEPLLALYRELESNSAVEIIRRRQNGSKVVLWEEDILGQLNVTGPFVYTDSDVVPDAHCPADAVGYLACLLRDHPQIFKAGLGLRLDDLPETYQFRNEVVAWESQFWRAPVAGGLFMAPIDTTFALYRPGSSFAMAPALRTGWPYRARHEPWYSDSAKPTDDELYYRASTAKVDRGHWGRSMLPAWLQAAVNVRAALEAPKLLHLGCGQDRIPGWINLDADPDSEADVVFDLETCTEHRLPFDDNSIDGIFMCHVLQYIDRTLPMMQELYRVAKPSARFVIRVPHGASDQAFAQPACKRIYFPDSFLSFAQPAYARTASGYAGDWRVSRIKLVVDPDLLATVGEVRMLERARRERNIVHEMIVELQAVKPRRPREASLLDKTAPSCLGTPIDDESVF